MIGALFTCLFWAISAICGQRAARRLGSMRANIARLSLAVVLLGLLTLWLHRGSFHDETFWWLILGGVVGFGIGDLGLYLALARIGSRLTVLITFCGAPVLGAFGEWLSCGALPRPAEAAAAAVIIFGVGLALKPTSPVHERYGKVAVGLIAAFFAAAGQGFGAVFSRVAIENAAELDLYLPPLSQAFQRVLGGTAFAAVAAALTFALHKNVHADHPKPVWSRKNIGWLMGATLCGPIIGLIFYQWGLSTAESWLVLIVIAMIPILMIPLAYWIERDRPTPQALVGAVIAVAGLITVTWLQRS